MAPLKIWKEMTGLMQPMETLQLLESLFWTRNYLKVSSITQNSGLLLFASFLYAKLLKAVVVFKEQGVGYPYDN